MIWKCLKSLLFCLDAETAHRWTVGVLKAIIVVDRYLGFVILRSVSGTRYIKEGAVVSVWGLEFLSSIGLAAGFDKNAEILEGLPALGFGFAEIGTVTPQPQKGNSKPRLFRDSKQLALFNRMGFNSDGAEKVAARVAKIRLRLPKNFRIGVNVGKNAWTSLENAHHDYVEALRPFEGWVDYIVLNVSSPNTPGLRSLQTAESLKQLLEGVNRLISSWKSRPPVLLKLAPEIQGDVLSEILKIQESRSVDGWVLTNTLGGAWKNAETGGWSGAPVAQMSEQRLVEVRAQSSLPIISVGGIMMSEHAKKRLLLGANLIQIYSGWIFNGPRFVSEIKAKIGS